MAELRLQDGLKEYVDDWGSPFSAMSFINNRITPAHRDSKSRKPYFDILSSIGSFNQAVLEFEGLGFDVVMRPGAVVGLLGSIVRHAVSDWGAGDRVCMAWYMRSSLHAYTDARPASWMSQEHYREYVANEENYLHRTFQRSLM